MSLAELGVEIALLGTGATATLMILPRILSEGAIVLGFGSLVLLEFFLFTVEG